jgi:hypothetical protein
VPQRFIIEDIQVQDCSGVIFRAVDSETGGAVAVRRFFPFGPTGGGLTADEQDEYASALEHLETISQPALRSIISGGCDPVDGIPFIATEWVEGTSLRHILAERSLSRAEATALLAHALEACEALSAVLGREGVWIETDPQTIIIGTDQTQRPITFWISPLRWLGQISGQKGMEPLVTLTEMAMGWSGEPPDSHGSHGLAGWLQWLRGADRNVSLAEARERLIATVNEESGPATHRPIQETKLAQCSDRKTMGKKSIALAWLLGCCLLTAAGLGGWILVQRNQQRIVEASGPLVKLAPVTLKVAAQEPGPPAIHSSSHDPETSVSLSRPNLRTSEQVSREATEKMAAAQQAERVVMDRQEAVRKRGDVYLSDDGDLLLARKGSVVKIEGRLAKVHATQAGNIYMSFSQKAGKNGPRGYVERDDVTPDLTPGSLENLVGRTIQMEGPLRIKNHRPEVKIKLRSAITEP